VNLAQKIELWPLSRLQPYASNARTHDDDQISKIAKSIVSYGFNAPILVDGADGIVAGHGRLMAAKKLGLEQVPVIVLDHLDEKQKKAYVLADNKLADLAGWDEDLLRQELDYLQNAEVDLNVLGWTDDELEDLFGGDVEPLDDMPELSDGDKSPFQQQTFTLSDEQVEIVNEALTVAKDMGPFVDTINENSNGNAIARVCELFLSWKSDHGLS
jgi:ParB family chromosome partitioning protein